MRNTAIEWTDGTWNPSTRLANIIGKLGPSALTVNEWTIPTPNSDPYELAIDSSGKVWFTESDADKIGMLDPSANKFYEWQIRPVTDLAEEVKRKLEETKKM